MKKIISMALCLGLFASCAKKDDSDDDTSSGNVSNALTTAVSTVTTSAYQITSLSPSSSSFVSSSLRSEKAILGTAFGSAWTTTSTVFNDERTSTSTSPKEWMGVQLSEEAARTNGSKISMFGRLKDGLDIFCAVGVGVGNIDGGSYPANDTYSIVLSGTTKTAIESQCGMSIDGQMEGATVTLLVEDAADTTYYDKKITITLPDNSTQIYFVRSNSTAINVATSEVNSNGLHRTVVAFDVASNIMKLEYISGPDAALSNGEHVAAYRLYYDEANDKGYMLALEHDEDTTDRIIKYILTGKPQATGAAFSLSLFASELHGTNIYEACVSASDGSITGTDGTYCSDSTSSLAGISLSTSNVWDSFISGWNNTNYNSVTNSTTLSFTDSTVHDASFATN